MTTEPEVEEFYRDCLQVVTSHTPPNEYRQPFSELLIWHVLVASLVHVSAAAVFENALKQRLEKLLGKIRERPFSRANQRERETSAQQLKATASKQIADLPGEWTDADWNTMGADFAATMRMHGYTEVEAEAAAAEWTTIQQAKHAPKPRL